MAQQKPRTHRRTSFFVMGNAEPMNSSSSPSDTSPIGRIDRGPVRGRWGSLLRTRGWKNETKRVRSGEEVDDQDHGPETGVSVVKSFVRC